MPAVGTVGNSSRTVIRQPGVNNFDIALFKNIPLHESLMMQIRIETYNVFNHTQFSAFNVSPQFNPAGAQINSQLGMYTAAAAARRMQLGARLNF